MTEIRPFKAVYYNKEKVKDLSKVVCPPYDVISKEQQKEYYDLDEHNLIRVLLGKEKSTDNNQNNKYTRAKETFDNWLKKGILLQDEKPCIYYYLQEYKVVGQKYSRLGFISLMKIQGKEGAKIFPHENTHSAAKEDRFKLWKILSANLSPIFVCFSDMNRKVEKIYEKHLSSKEPVVDVVDNEGVRHILWRLEDPVLVDEVVSTLSEQQLFIADGHHRYEVSRQLKNHKLSKMTKKPTGEEPCNYVMTYFTNMDSKDLQILPMHRIVKKLPQDFGFLEEFFRADKIKTKDELTILLARAGKNEHAFGLYTKEGIKLLRLKHKLLIDQYVSEGSPEYRCLDATILKFFVFDRAGVKSEDIMYTKDLNEVIHKVDEGEAQAGFLMNPVKIQQLRNIALNGERMPPKTTYFYPKVLSGLTIYKI